MFYLQSLVSKGARYMQYVLAAVALATFCQTAMAEKVNLNSADAETLQYIPGIGPAKAAAIIKLREQSGGFKSMQALLDVSGIGNKTLVTIAEYGALDAGVSSLTEAMKSNPPRASRSQAAKPAESSKPVVSQHGQQPG